VPIRRQNLPRPVAWTLCGVSIALGIASLSLVLGTLWLRGSLPQLDGEMHLAGLNAPVEILRDADGIVTIRAQDEHDAAFALGFAHAQDRLWQMDFTRRTGAGRFSELLGPRTLPHDRFMRTLGLARVAQRNLEALPDGTRAVLDAYAAGVNAFLESRNGPLPPEFQVLRYTPEPWRPEDSLIWGRLMAFQLSGNWRDEILRARLASRLTPEQIAFLWPAYGDDTATTLRDLAETTRGLPLERFATAVPPEIMPKDASNAWAISGTRSATGAPILAGDPHLGLSAPGFWYLARIETPERTLVGATAPGLPFVVLGQNGAVAWTFTTTHSDTQDLFIERVNADDPTHYDTPEGPRPFATRQETIAVRGDDSQSITVRETRHGPVISDAIADRLDDLPDAVQGTDKVLALAWPALRADDRTAVAMHAINRAKNAGEIEAALADIGSPQQNILYADRDGAIGFAVAGRTPLRKSGDGRQPVPGWSGDYDWIGAVPAKALPRGRDPKSGAFVNANNRVAPEGYRYLLSADWPAPYRAARIEALLGDLSKNKASVEGAAAMMLDTVSLSARALMPLLLATRPADARAKEAIAILEAWDGSMARDKAAPLIFHAWAHALTEALMADELGPAFDAFQRPNAAILSRILTETGDWCDDVTTEPAETCLGQLSASLDTALDDLEARFGVPLRELRWGTAHVAPLAHPVLSHVPLFEALFGFAVETPGGNDTLNRGSFAIRPGGAGSFAHIHGPGYRAVYDLADPENSRFMIATGQSGNPFSPWYGSLAVPWRDGEYLKLVGAATAAPHRLRLTPP
jgi:penicillin amidase